MKIWIKGKIYTVEKEILVVYLEDKDKYNIADMEEQYRVYCCYDELQHTKKREIHKLLKELRPLLEAA